MKSYKPLSRPVKPIHVDPVPSTWKLILQGIVGGIVFWGTLILYIVLLG